MTFDSTPFPFQEDGTLIVPGHGRLCGTTDVVDYRDMVTIIHDRVADLIKQGKTLDEIQRANPTVGYRRQYGSNGPMDHGDVRRGTHQGLTSKGVATMTGRSIDRVGLVAAIILVMSVTAVVAGQGRGPTTPAPAAKAALRST